MSSLLEHAAYPLAITALAAISVIGDVIEIPDECKALDPEKLCCDLPFDEDSTEDEKKIISDCVNMYHQNYTALKPGEKNSVDFFDLELSECIDECYFGKMGFLTPDKKLHVENISKDLARTLENHKEWTDKQEKAMKKCIEEASTQVDKNSKCQSGSFEFYVCLLVEMYKNCPEESWTKSDYCDKEKSLMGKCAPYMFL